MPRDIALILYGTDHHSIKKSENKPYTLYQMVNKVLDRNQSKVLPDYTDNIQQLAADFNEYYIAKIEKIREGIPASCHNADLLRIRIRVSPHYLNLNQPHSRKLKRS